MRERLVDEVKIYVKGGDGGSGCTSFRREKCVPRGGPDGGNGGDGGSVYLEVDEAQSDLLSFKYKVHFKAHRGAHGQGSGRDGKRGEDFFVKVPPGTIVYDVESGDPVADLVEHGQRFLAASGGRGGRGNRSFASSVRRVPHFSEKGEPGREKWLKLILKILADVGLVGFPNAGKSSLLSVITAAQPKIASYPFTTISPNLGVAHSGPQTVVFADVPGLIEGAHSGLGLGLLFLRHIERTRILVHLLDVSSAEFREDPMVPYEKLRTELYLYNEKLLDRPEIIVFNKTDLVEDGEELDRARSVFAEAGLEVWPISCKSGEGVEALTERIFTLAAETPVSYEVVDIVERKVPKVEFAVKKVEDYFVVEGAMIENLIAMFDLDNDEAVDYLQRRIRYIGVEEALVAAGAGEGDIVVIGGNEFDFSPDV